MSQTLLKMELRQVLGSINSQIVVIVEKAARMNIAANTMQDMNGAYVLTPLLVAKANALAGLAILEASK